MRKNLRERKQKGLGISTLCFLLLLLWCIRGVHSGAAQASEESLWRADHHVHLASPELCRLVGECLESNRPPAVYAADAIRALDQARVEKGVVLSCAYLYGLPSLHRTPREVAELTRRENEFIAAQVAQFPDRLVGFLSVNPLQESAIAEIKHWQGSKQLIGLKLHFTASAVDIRNAAERRQVAKVLADASAAHMPVVIHIGGGKFNAADAELFIRKVLPAAGDSWVQIAHAGGGLPEQDGNHLNVLRVFADHVAQDDAATRHVLFDVSYVPGPEETASAAAALAEQMRRIGMKRFLFGSDFNVLTPQQEVDNLRKLGLTDEEWKTLRENCAPWACFAP